MHNWGPQPQSPWLAKGKDILFPGVYFQYPAILITVYVFHSYKPSSLFFIQYLIHFLN